MKLHLRWNILSRLRMRLTLVVLRYFALFSADGEGVLHGSKCFVDFI